MRLSPAASNAARTRATASSASSRQRGTGPCETSKAQSTPLSDGRSQHRSHGQPRREELNAHQ
eukprot:3038219-Pyramimonas_sp.AAC.1